MESTTPPRTSQHDIWNDLVGEAWVRHAEVHDRHAAPFGDAVLDAVGPFGGAAVLDVGCGTGAISAEVASRGAGEVVGVDISRPMIEAARASNDRPNVRFVIGDAATLDDSARYDVILSRFGVMFFDDPAEAFTRLRTVGTPDARLGFCCWGPPADNPWMLVPVMATIPVLGPPTFAGPNEPGPFSLAEPEKIQRILDESGWRDVDISTLTLDLPHPAGDADSVARVVIEFSPPIAESLQRQPDRANDARAVVADALRPFERDGVVNLCASARIVTARW
jgi:SAM-dependent methyltransferase